MATWNPVSDSLLLTGIRSVYIYDPSSLQFLGYFAAHRLINDFAENDWIINSIWSPDGIQVDSTTSAGIIYVWNASTEEGMLESIFTGHATSVRSMIWNSATNFVASGDLDGRIFIWDPATGETIAQLMGHTGAILDIDWSANGQQIVSTSVDNTMRVWDWPSGTMSIIESGYLISVVAYTPRGDRLAYGGEVADLDSVVIHITSMPSANCTAAISASDSLSLVDTISAVNANGHCHAHPFTIPPDVTLEK